MRGKRAQRLLLLLAASDRLAVAAIFGREHQVTQLGVVVAVRPAVVVPCRELDELLRGFFRTLRQREQLGPVLTQLIATVLRRVQLARRRDGEPHGVADARSEAGAARLRLIEPGRVEPPHAGPVRELGAGVLPRRLARAILHLTGVGGGSDVDEQGAARGAPTWSATRTAQKPAGNVMPPLSGSHAGSAADWRLVGRADSDSVTTPTSSAFAVFMPSSLRVEPPASPECPRGTPAHPSPR